jgi:hypothetical protein
VNWNSRLWAHVARHLIQISSNSVTSTSQLAITGTVRRKHRCYILSILAHGLCRLICKNGTTSDVEVDGNACSSEPAGTSCDGTTPAVFLCQTFDFCTCVIVAPPHFEIKLRNQTSRRGEPTVLQCEARGEKPIGIRWNMNNKRLDPKTDTRQVIPTWQIVSLFSDCALGCLHHVRAAIGAFLSRCMPPPSWGLKGITRECSRTADSWGKGGEMVSSLGQ